MRHISRIASIHAQTVALHKDSRSHRLKSLIWTDVSVKDEERKRVDSDALSPHPHRWRVRSLAHPHYIVRMSTKLPKL